MSYTMCVLCTIAILSILLNWEAKVSQYDTGNIALWSCTFEIQSISCIGPRSSKYSKCRAKIVSILICFFHWERERVCVWERERVCVWERERERGREGGRREESEEAYVAQALVSNIDSSKVAAACVLVLRFIYTTLDATYMSTSAFCLLSILFLVMSTHTVHMYVCVCVCYILYVSVYSLF